MLAVLIGVHRRFLLYRFVGDIFSVIGAVEADESGCFIGLLLRLGYGVAQGGYAQDSAAAGD